jgi:hypothetical protein
MELLRHQAGGQYGEAFASLRLAKNVFWSILLASLAVQLAGFVLVRFSNLIVGHPVQAAPVPLKSASAPVNVVVPNEQPATAASRPARPERARAAAAPAASTTPARGEATLLPSGQDASESPWRQIFDWAMPASMFLCLTAGLLLALVLLLCVALSLLARTGGIEGFLGAFFWALLLWVLLIPWQQAFWGRLLLGVPYTLGDLVDATRRVIFTPRQPMWEHIMYYARYVGFPLLAILMLGIIQGKFARGYGRMALSVAQTAIKPAEPGAKV